MNSTDLFPVKVNLKISWEASDSEIRQRILKIIILLGPTNPVHRKLINKLSIGTMFVKRAGRLFIEVRYLGPLHTHSENVITEQNNQNKWRPLLCVIYLLFDV